jgi:hypothetical protein
VLKAQGPWVAPARPTPVRPIYSPDRLMDALKGIGAGMGTDPCAAALLPIFGEAEEGILPKAVIPST